MEVVIEKYISILVLISVMFSLLCFAINYFSDDPTGVLSVGLCLILILSFISILLIRIIDLLSKKDQVSSFEELFLTLKTKCH